MILGLLIQFILTAFSIIFNCDESLYLK